MFCYGGGESLEVCVMVIFSVDFVDFEYDIRNFVKGWRKVDMDSNIII